MKSKRTFGVEIEFFTFYEDYAIPDVSGDTIHYLVNKLRQENNKFPIVSGDRSTNYPKSWKLTRDSSVSGDGLELVSPILSGNEDLKTLKDMLSSLRKYAFVDRTTGQHVHVACDETFAFAVVLAAMAPEFTNFIPPTRRQRGYCAPYSEQEIEQLKNVDDPIDFAISNIGRKKAVNLCSMRKHKTVEFRALEGNLEPEVLLAYIDICTTLVDAVSSKNKILLFSTQQINDIKAELSRTMEVESKNKFDWLCQVAKTISPKNESFFTEAFLLTTAKPGEELILNHPLLQLNKWCSYQPNDRYIKLNNESASFPPGILYSSEVSPGPYTKTLLTKIQPLAVSNQARKILGVPLCNTIQRTTSNLAAWQQETIGDIAFFSKKIDYSNVVTFQEIKSELAPETIEVYNERIAFYTP